jgi:hypothetical protein
MIFIFSYLTIANNSIGFFIPQQTGMHVNGAPQMMQPPPMVQGQAPLPGPVGPPGNPCAVLHELVIEDLCLSIFLLLTFFFFFLFLFFY